MYLNSKWWFGFLTVTTELETFELVLRGRFRTLTRRREGRESCTEEKQEREHDRGMNPHPSNKLSTQALKGGCMRTLYEVHLVKSMVFPVVMYGCESWTVKKAECRRIDAFELWCWRRLLRVLWTARRSNQSILKEISPGCSLERLMLRLKRQYFGHLMRRVDSLEKTLMMGGIAGRRRRGQQNEMAGWHHRLDAHEVGWTPGVGDGQGGLMCCDSWGCKRWTRLSDNWTELNWN